MGGGIAHLIQIQTGVTNGTLQGRHQRLRRGLRGAVCQGREGGVHNVHTGISRHQQHHVTGTGGVVGVQMDGDADRLLKSLHQRVGVHRKQEVGHVLNANGVCAHLFQLLSQLYEVLLVVDGGNGVGQGGLHLTAVFLGGLDGLFQIAHIVQRVKNADDIDTVFNGFTAEGVHHVVCIVLVAQNILATEQHLQFGIGQTLLQSTKALPRILVEKTHAGVEGGAAPAFQGVVPDGIQHLQSGQHILNGHAGSRLRLMSVPEDGIGDQQGFIGQKFHSILPPVNRKGRSARLRQ